MPKAKVVKLKRVEDGSNHNDSMTSLIARLLINVLALLVVEYIVPGFVLGDLKTAVIAAIVIGVINTYIRPILQIIALPITVITFGLGAFLVNVLMLLFAAAIVPGFEIKDFLTAVVASILLTLVSWFLHKLSHK